MINKNLGREMRKKGADPLMSHDDYMQLVKLMHTSTPDKVTKEEAVEITEIIEARPVVEPVVTEDIVTFPTWVNDNYNAHWKTEELESVDVPTWINKKTKKTSKKSISKIIRTLVG